MSVTVKWQSDGDVAHCTQCKKRFGIKRRKHHCRECGCIFCDKCSSYKVVINGHLKRSCLDCYQQSMNRNTYDSSSSVSGEQYIPKVSDQQFRKRAEDKDNPALSTSNLQWFDGIVYIRQYGDGHSIYCQFPDSKFSEQFLSDLVITMKNLLTKLNEGKLLYRLRDRSLPGATFKDEHDESIGTAVTNATIFLNCYISVSSFTDISDDESEAVTSSYKESVALISKWPFRQLSNDMLDRIRVALELQTQPLKSSRLSSVGERASVFSSPRKSVSSPSAAFNFASPESASTGMDNIDDDDDEDNNRHEKIIESVLEVAYSQIKFWPEIIPGSCSYLTFFGEVLNCSVPPDLVMDEINPRLLPLLLSINLVEVLGTLGLVQHLWTIWEMIVTGQDIVVVATNPVHCCDIVLALASILEPVGFVGDVRPYLHGEDKELLVLAATAQLKVVQRHEKQLSSDEVEVTNTFKKLAARNRSMIVGVTDMDALAELEDFSAVIFVDSTDYLTIQHKKQKYLQTLSTSTELTESHDHSLDPLYSHYQEELSDAVFKGMRNRNAAIDKYIPVNYTNDMIATYQSFSKAKKTGFARFFNLKDSSAHTKESPSFREQYEWWQRQGQEDVNNGKRKTWLLLRSQPSAVALVRIIKRIQRLHPDDRLIFGDKILRDNLQDISKAFLGHSKDPRVGESMSMSNAHRSMDGTLIDQDAMEEILSQRRSLEMAMEAEKKGMWNQGIDDIVTWIRDIPFWVVQNFATVLLWSVYMVLFGILAWMGIPAVLIVIVAYLVSVPEKAPDAMVSVVDTILPLKSIFSKRTDTSNTSDSLSGPPRGAINSNHPSSSVSSSPAEYFNYADYCGIWKRVNVDNYESFLAAQGVNYLQRKVAASIAMQHTLVIDGNGTQLHLEERGGPIDVETDYIIDPTKFKETKVLKAAFEDTVSWDISYQTPEEADGKFPLSPKLLITKKRLPDCPYELKIWRWIEPNSHGRIMRLRAVYHVLAQPSQPGFSKVNNVQDVESFCTFEYVGPPSFAYPLADANVGIPQNVDVDPSTNDFKEHNHSESDSNITDEYNSLPENRLPSNLIEEEILSTASTDGNDLLYASTSSSGKSSRKSWLVRRFSSRSVMKDSTSVAQASFTSSDTIATAKLDDDHNLEHLLKSPLSATSVRKNASPSHSVASKATKTNTAGTAVQMKDAVPVALPLSRASSTTLSNSAQSTHSHFTDFSGVWIRTRTENFEAFAEATGLPALQRKIAAQMSLTHIITMNPPELSMFRLQERGGPLATDFTLTLNSERDVAVLLQGKRMLHRAWYMEPNMLIMFRRAEDASFEHVLIRSLDAESSASHPQLILRALHRDLHTGKEVEAISFFSKASSSPNSPPVPDTPTKPGAPPRKFLSLVEHKRTAPIIGNDFAANTVVVAKRNSSADFDRDEDDDDEALKKMHSISTAQREQQTQSWKNSRPK